MRRSRKILISNFLIIVSFVIFIVAVLPFIRLSVMITPDINSSTISDSISTAQVQQYSIEIPKIQASAKVITNIDPWNQSEYSHALEEGVAHAKGTALPGEGKTSFLFAHSSTELWRLTQYNTPFFKIGELESGDEIIIKKNDQKIRYIVFDKKEVSPEETQYLKQDQGDVLILQTCTPIGTALKRLLVFARPAA